MEFSARGHVWPPVAAFSIESGAWVPELGMDLRIKCQAESDWVRVTATSDRAFRDPRTAANYLQETAQYLIGGVEFAYGHFPSLAVRSILVDGKHEKFGNIQQLETMVRAYKLTPGRVLAAVGRHPQLNIAIRSIGLAVNEPWATHMFCYRAIESLRQVFRLPHEPSGDSEARAANWDRMWKALNISDDFSKEMVERAEAERHGETFASSWEEREKSISSAIAVVASFVAFAEKT